MKPANTWFTSDLHLGHRAVIDFCDRPFFSVEDMDLTIVHRWNACVKPEDEVYVLGDVCFYKASLGIPLLQKLSGRKILVRGNHDKWSKTQYIAAGFSVVSEEMAVKLQGQYFRLSHYPYAPSEAEKVDTTAHDLRYLERRPPDKGSFLLCGHVHKGWKTKDRMFNVGVDVHDYRPVSLGEIMKWANQPKTP